jgi:LemA protein
VVWLFRPIGPVDGLTKGRDQVALSKGAIIGIGIVVVILVVIFIGAVFTIVPYNRLTRMDVATQSAWAEVNNQLQRRNDLIPNIVETVKGYATHEKELFEHIADARARIGSNASSVQDKIQASNELSGFLSRLLMVVENYPQLKANENFMALQDELAGTENRLAVSRNRYNEAVREYNTNLRTFPSNMIAGLFGFTSKQFFDVPESAKQVPQVHF